MTGEREMPKLLPCPFCGCEDIDPDGCVAEIDGQNGSQAVCGECEACGPTGHAPLDAAMLWNARANNAGVAQLAELRPSTPDVAGSNPAPRSSSLNAGGTSK